VRRIVGEEVDFELNEAMILNLDNIRLIILKDEDILFKINTEMGIGCFSVRNEIMNLSYVVTSLQK